MFRKCSTLTILILVGMMQTACSSSAEEARRRAGGIPWWGWLLLIVVMAALFVWLLLSQRKADVAPPTKPEAAAPSHVVETPEGVARRASIAQSVFEAPVQEVVEPDDLKLIEGIGPKISGLLQAAGIMTFAHLASTDVRRLKDIIAEAGLTALADPSSWPEQASLAAMGQWDALKALQGELKGGRRV